MTAGERRGKVFFTSAGVEAAPFHKERFLELTAEDAGRFVDLAHAVVNEYQWSEEDHDDLVQCALYKLTKALQGGKEIHNPKNFVSVVFRRAVRSYYHGHFGDFKPPVSANGRVDSMKDRRGQHVPYVEYPNEDGGEKDGDGAQSPFATKEVEAGQHEWQLLSTQQTTTGTLALNELEDRIRSELGHQHAAIYHELLFPSQDLIEEAVEHTERIYEDGNVRITRSMVASHLGMTDGPFYRKLREIKNFLADQTELVA